MAHFTAQPEACSFCPYDYSTMSAGIDVGRFPFLFSHVFKAFFIYIPYPEVNHDLSHFHGALIPDSDL